MFNKLRDPVNGITHLIGAVLSVLGLIFLVVYSVFHATPLHVFSFIIFGISLILLYTASTLYHLLQLSERGVRIFRIIDHMMIFILIAGSYTPICLIPLRGAWGYSLLSIIWGLTIGGIIMKVFWLHAPRWLYTGIYLLMGWLVVVAFLPLVRVLSFSAMMWLVAGGLSYSVGAVVYALKKPNFAKYFGFHEIFHLFILAGSACHFWLMYKYVMLMR